MKLKLPLPEQNDFHYLLTIMQALHSMDEYAWLPELFTILESDEAVAKLCHVAGGEVIRIPTLDELQNSITALQWYYDVYITQKKTIFQVPNEYKPLVYKIRDEMSKE